MVKIKITSNEKVLKGSILKGIVKPFGTSAHISTSKKHMGKNVSVVIPENVIYSWVLSEEKKKIFVNKFKKGISKYEGKLKFYYLKIVENFNKDKFAIDDLYKAMRFLENNNECKNLLKELRSKYNFN
jgi:putative transposon-encoded protein